MPWGSHYDGARVRRRHHGRAPPSIPHHVGAWLSGRRLSGALPRRSRHDGARLRWRHHVGALPLSWRHAGARQLGKAASTADDTSPLHEVSKRLAERQVQTPPWCLEYWPGGTTMARLAQRFCGFGRRHGGVLHQKPRVGGGGVGGGGD